MNKKILVIGSGAIGGITAAILKKAGYDITLITKYQVLADKISKQGVQIKGAKGDFHIQIPSFAKVNELEGLFDIILIATKALDMAQAAKDCLNYMHAKSMVVSMQNGLCEEELAEIVGINRTIGCVVGWGATMLEPGVLDMTSEGEFVIGTLDNSRKEDLELLQTIFSNIVDTTISQNIIGHLYSKLIINSCITSLGAISGLLLGTMLKLKKARTIFIDIIKESIAVSNAMGILVEPYANKLNYYEFLKGTHVIAIIKRHLTIFVIGLKYKRLKSSSLQSLERGNKTEIDYFNGYIAKKGKELHVECPTNQKVVEMIKQIEAGTLPIQKENFNAFH